MPLLGQKNLFKRGGEEKAETVRQNEIYRRPILPIARNFIAKVEDKHIYYKTTQGEVVTPS